MDWIVIKEFQCEQNQFTFLESVLRMCLSRFMLLTIALRERRVPSKRKTKYSIVDDAGKPWLTVGFQTLESVAAASCWVNATGLTIQLVASFDDFAASSLLSAVRKLKPVSLPRSARFCQLHVAYKSPLRRKWKVSVNWLCTRNCRAHGFRPAFAWDSPISPVTR